MEEESGEHNRRAYENADVISHYKEFAEFGLFRYEESAIRRFVPPRSRVLDIGCGTGRTTLPLSGMGMDVTGIDISEGMISAAAARCPGSRFAVMDVRRMDGFDNGFFDAALFSLNGFALLDARGKETALAQIHRVLKSGGVFIFTTPLADAENGYFRDKAKAGRLDASIYYDRIRIGDETFCDNGATVMISVPFERDVRDALEQAGFDIMLSARSTHDAESEAKPGEADARAEILNETTLWVARRT